MIRPRVFFLHTFLLSYVIFTAAAFFMTMTGIRPTFLPWPLVNFSYGMMAPYQGYVTFSQGIRVEGQLPDGTWEFINHRPYYPYIRGERISREWLLHYQQRAELSGSEAELEAKYRLLASQLLRLEREQGRDYRAVRLFWERWPKSVARYDFLRNDLFITSEPIVHVEN